MPAKLKTRQAPIDKTFKPIMKTRYKYPSQSQNRNKQVKCPCCQKEMRADNIEAHMMRQLLKADIPDVQKALIRKKYPAQKHRVVYCSKCCKETSYKNFQRHSRRCKSLRGQKDEIEMEPQLKRGRPFDNSQQ